MSYTVKEVSQKTGVPAHTLRFYEKQGVLPFAERNENGNRLYDESSIEWIETIVALRSTGMSLADLKQYLDYFQDGDNTLLERRQLMADHKIKVEDQLMQIIKTLEKINYKMALYDVQLKELENKLPCL